MIKFLNEGSCGPNYSAMTTHWDCAEQCVSFMINEPDSGVCSKTVMLRRDAVIYLRDQLDEKLKKMPAPKPSYTGSL